MKNFTSWVLIVGSLTFALLIIFEQPKPTPINEKTISKVPKNSIEQPKSLNHESASVNQFNFTENVAKKISEELLDLNPEGPTTIEDRQWLNVNKPEDVVNKVIEESIANFDFRILRPEIKIADLKIIPDSGKTAIENYIKTYKEITSANLLKPPTQNYEATISDLSDLFESYKKTIALLYEVKVPKEIIAIHQQGLTILETQKNILEKIINSENDPVTAIIAASFLPTTNKEMASFQEKIDKLINS